MLHFKSKTLVTALLKFFSKITSTIGTMFINVNVPIEICFKITSQKEINHFRKKLLISLAIVTKFEDLPFVISTGRIFEMKSPKELKFSETLFFS